MHRQFRVLGGTLVPHGRRSGTWVERDVAFNSLRDGVIDEVVTTALAVLVVDGGDASVEIPCGHIAVKVQVDGDETLRLHMHLLREHLRRHGTSLTSGATLWTRGLEPGELIAHVPLSLARGPHRPSEVRRRRTVC